MLYLVSSKSHNHQQGLYRSKGEVTSVLYYSFQLQSQPRQTIPPEVSAYRPDDFPHPCCKTASCGSCVLLPSCLCERGWHPTDNQPLTTQLKTRSDTPQSPRFCYPFTLVRQPCLFISREQNGIMCFGNTANPLPPPPHHYDR